MLAHRHRRWPNIISQLGQCIWVVAFLATGDEIVTPIAIAANNLCTQNAGLLLGHRQTCWINIEATLVSRPVIAVDAGVEKSCLRSVVLSQLRTQLTGIEPAMGCDSGPLLNRNWVGRPTSCTLRDTHSKIYWQVSH